MAPHLANGRLESGEWRVEKGGGAHGFDLLLLDEKSTLIQGSITVHLLNYFENHCSIGLFQ